MTKPIINGGDIGILFCDGASLIPLAKNIKNESNAPTTIAAIPKNKPI